MAHGPLIASIMIWAVFSPWMSAAQDIDVEQESLPFYAEDARLREYVNEALRQNPSILEARARYQAAREKVPQVEGLPDPVLSFSQAIRSVETRVGPQQNILQFSQKLPWFGKLDLKGKVALQEAEAQYQLYLAQQRAIIAAVKRTFYHLAYVDTALRITREERSVLEHYEELAQVRYASGQGLQQASSRSKPRSLKSSVIWTSSKNSELPWKPI